MRPAAPASPLFPYTTLFRSEAACPPVGGREDGSLRDELRHAVRRELGLQPLDELRRRHGVQLHALAGPAVHPRLAYQDRKSTRLNSSHTVISYAVFCLKKKK